MIKILTIDDESEFTSLIEAYFSIRGFEVLVAHHGDEGLRLAKDKKPEVCLIDLKMPGLHGDAVLKEICNHIPEARCIMITASEGGGKTRSGLMAMGAVACFDKPLMSLKDLEQKIREVLTL